MKLKYFLFSVGLLFLSLPAVSAQDGVPQPAHGWHFESWIALAITVTSLLTAWAMNYGAPRVRAMGTMLAAAGCFAVAGWFLFFVLGTGFLENPKPNQTPLDSAKPALLWAQAMAALVGGVGLTAVAVRQSSSSETLVLPADNESSRYGRVSRQLHWSIAILFIALIPMGIFASIIPEGTPYRNAYYVAHKTIGVLVFVLILVRLVWNKISKRPELDSTLKPWERKLAHSVHMMLYLLMIAVPVTGYVMTSYHGYPTYFFGLEIQPFWDKGDAYIVWGLFHKYLLPYLLYIVLGAHILGALKHHFIDKHAGAFKRMVS